MQRLPLPTTPNNTQHPIRKSPGYYDCLNKVKDPKAPKPTFAEIIKKERNDVDMARQIIKAKENEDNDWVIVEKGWER